MELDTSLPWMPTGKSMQLLVKMLEGKSMTVLDTIEQFNMMCPNARSAEMRKKGWPIRTKRILHPHLLNEWMTAYYFDAHFLGWFAKNTDRNPSLYAGQDGRGKFSQDIAIVEGTHG